MLALTASQAAREVILQDAIQRDLAAARRAYLLEILWHERYLTRRQLIVRLEGHLGRGCFGLLAWEDNFYRDLRVVKRALQAAGYSLRYSRKTRRSGYYLDGQPAISHELAQIVRTTIAQVDPNQIEVLRRLTPAQRFCLGCSVSDAARNVVAYRLRLRQPELNPSQANFLTLQKRGDQRHQKYE
jgi:hypothetical protein